MKKLERTAAIYGIIGAIVAIIATIGVTLEGLAGKFYASIAMLILAILTLLGYLIWKKFTPYSKEDERDFEVYEGFAKHLQKELLDIDESEGWEDDEQYIDLEIKVEPSTFLLKNNRNNLSSLFKRRSNFKYKTLYDAQSKTNDTIILLEGEPGSGKSTSLRQLAKIFLKDFFAKRRITVLPLYINLRGLSRNPNTSIDRNLINDYIFDTLNRIKDPSLDAFLKSDFEVGRRKGTWLFLLDSFDEIPEILSAKDADEIINQYTKAISDFSQGISQCQILVGSRYYRGPTKTSWTKFSVSPMSEKQKKEFVKNRSLKLHPDDQRILIGGLVGATEEIRGVSTNPLFLELLCDYLHVHHRFPENVHGVFENYVSARFHKDQGRLKVRFALTPEQIRLAAEQIAFCISVDHEIGLSSQRVDLIASMEKHGFECPPYIHKVLDAMEYIKLARSDNSEEEENRRQFSFAHRRLQEYFATRLILRRVELVSPKELLTNPRLRETCVTIFQTQSINELQPLIREATRLIRRHKVRIERQCGVSNLEKFVFQSYQERRDAEVSQFPTSFEWPDGLLYFLDLLQDAFHKRVDLAVPAKNLSFMIGCILYFIYDSSKSILLDKKWVLEVLGAARFEQFFNSLLTDGLGSSTFWIKNVAYNQLANYWDTGSEYIEYLVRKMLVEMALSGKFYREKEQIYFFLSRFYSSDHFQKIHRQLEWVYKLDFLVFSLFGMSILLLEALKIANDAEIFYLTSAIIIFAISISPLLVWVSSKEDQNFSLRSYFLENDNMREHFSLPRKFETRLMAGNTGVFLYTILILTGSVLFVKQTSDLVVLVTFFFPVILWSYFVLLPPSTFRLLFQTGKYSIPRYWFITPFLLVHLDFIRFKENLSRDGFFPWLRRRKILRWSFLITLTIIVALYPNESLSLAQKLTPFMSFAWQYISELLVSISWPNIKLPPEIISLADFLINLATTILTITIIPLSIFAAIIILLSIVKSFIQLAHRISHIPSENKRFSELVERTSKLKAKEFLDSITYYNIKLSKAAAGHILSNGLLDNDNETVLTLKFFIAYLQLSLENQHPNFNEINTRISPPQHVVEWQLFFEKNISQGLSVFGGDILEMANRALEALVVKK